ncbi:hypothetical protein L596_006547 [Steinernema carpocapsae]|uniref:Cationic amino acid transporter C-terminal domain-containing protein n=1 Tax=Steinernema carpocapsae TaxID=34508 RepID=A0A4U8V9L7_STECR|nr:hypothetical protein L596_006547 [Steinernema carpocapsae]
MGSFLYRLNERFFRLKNVGTDVMETRMKRCLSTTDITLLGVGHMIGAGIYVLTVNVRDCWLVFRQLLKISFKIRRKDCSCLVSGSVVRNSAGPSIVLSFVCAGFASLLSALCYAEFGARFPKAGSAYTYTYIGVGELWAFIIGWNIILEHMLGAAAVARSWSGYLDSLLGHAIKNSTITNFGRLHSSSFFGDYPDLVAFMVVIAVALFIALGSKTSTNFNSVFTVVNMCVIAFVVTYGLTFANFDLWTGTDPNTGNSNFFPMGVNGMLAGAASCFFAYIGFDGLATAGEEAADPSRAIPMATFISMSIVTAAYVFMSAALTLMVPYWQVHPTAAFSDAFATRGAIWAKYVVSLGALSGMTTSLVGAMFALPRCVYAMAEDGLIFKTFAHINEKTKVPVNAVVVFGAATAIIALLFDIETLVEFLSIGTLLAYTIVSACVIILRYRPSVQDEAEDINVNYEGRIRSWVPFQQFLSVPLPGQTVTYAVVMMTISDFGLSILFANGAIHSKTGIFGIFLFASISVSSLITICLHHQNKAQIDFKVPMVPLLPAGSMLINILLMLHLAPITWVRLVFWLAIGMAIYLFYGMKHSSEEHRDMTEGISKSTTYESVVSQSEQTTPSAAAVPEP